MKERGSEVMKSYQKWFRSERSRLRRYINTPIVCIERICGRISSRPTNLNNMKCCDTESFFLEFRQDTGSLGRLVLESLTEPNRGIAGQPGPTLATRISVGFKGLGDSDTQRSQFHVFYFIMPPSAPR